MKVIVWIEEVESFVSSTLKTKYVTPEISRARAFGAIDFALRNGLIDDGEKEYLLQKYDIG